MMESISKQRLGAFLVISLLVSRPGCSQNPRPARPEAEPNTQIIFGTPDSAHNLLPLQATYADMPADMKNLVQIATGAAAFACPSAKQALLLHFGVWRQNADSSFALISNEWYVYHVHSKGDRCEVSQAGLKANGDQRLYADTDAILIGFTTFQTTNGTPAAVPATVTYKASASADAAENVTDLTDLISAIAGLSAKAGNTPPPTADRFVAAKAISGYRKGGKSQLPFIFNLSYSVGLPPPASNPGQRIPQAGGAGSGGGEGAGQTPNNGKQDVVVAGSQQSSTSQVTDCTTLSSTKTPCSSSKTFRSDDPEVWDVSVGISIPGVPEVVYGSNLTAPPTTKHHTDFYGFVDIYPFAKFLSKESPVPHLLFGVPLTSQPLHRSSYGIAENFTSWTSLERHGFPFRMSVYAAIVYEKVNYRIASNVDGTVTQMLKPDWTLKPNFGIEVSVPSILSKLPGGSKSKSSSK